MIPYEPPKPVNEASPDLAAKLLVPGRFAIWSIAALSFCFSAASIFGAWAFWRTPELLADFSGFGYYFYALRPVVIAIGFLGLSWKCVRYVDAVTHNSMNSDEVLHAHGGVWNWMAVMLAAFVMLVACLSIV